MLTNLSNYLRNFLLLCVMLLATNSFLHAQQTDCSGPSGVEIAPLEVLQGDGTFDNPYVMCIDQPISLLSTGVNTVDDTGPNPGLIFLVYTSQPTGTDPGNDDATDLVALTDINNTLIINEGEAIFSNTGYQFVEDFPIGVYIVPVIVPNIDDPTQFNPDCTGIDINATYTYFLFLDPEENPDCTLDMMSDCEANAGTTNFSELEASYCGTTDVALTTTGFTEVDTDGAAYLQGLVLTDLDSIILDVTLGGMATFTLEEGDYLVHSLNFPCSLIEGLGFSCTDPPLELLIGLAAGDFLGLADCFNLISSDPIAILPVDAPECGGGGGDCEANAGMTNFGELEAFYCGTTDVALTTTGFTEVDAAGAAYLQGLVVTDLDSIILDVTLGGMATFTLEEGNYLVHSLNFPCSLIEGLGFSCTDPPLELLIGLAAGDFLGLADCYDLVSSSAIAILPADAPECVGGGDCEANAGMTNFGELEAFYCGTTDLALTTTGFTEVDAAGAAYLQGLVVTDLDSIILDVTLGGMATFTLEEGNYLVHSLNFPCSLIEGLGFSCTDPPLELLIGLAAGDFLGLADCYDLVSSSAIAILPADSPECTTFECEANAGNTNFSSIAPFYCGSVDLALLAEGFTTTGTDVGYLQLLVLTDANLVILDALVGGMGAFALTEGEYIVHALNLPCDAGIDCANPVLDGLIGAVASDVLASLDCFDIASSAPFSVLAEDAPECADTCNANAGTLDVSGFYCAGSMFTVASVGFNEDFDYEQLYLITDEDLLVLAVGLGADIVVNPDPGTYVFHSLNVAFVELPADLNEWVGQAAGDVLASLSCFDIYTSASTVLLQPLTASYTIDCETGNVDVLFAGGFPQYNLEEEEEDSTGFVYELEGDIEGNFVIGTPFTLNVTQDTILAFELSDDAGCSQEFQLSIEACGELDPISIGDIVYEVGDSTYTFTFDIIGGTGVYTVTNGSVVGGSFNSLEFACGENVVVVVSDDQGNTLEITVEAPCDAAGVECPGLAEAGTLTGAQDFYCAGEGVQVSATGFNATADYTQLYVATQGDDFIIAAVSADGNFGTLPAGKYELHSFNFYNANPPILPDNPIGVSAVAILEQTETCFDLDPAAATTVGVLAPVTISNDYECDPLSGVYTLTFSFAGGLPAYAAEYGSTGVGGESFYAASGDVSGNFSIGEDIVIQSSDNTPYSISAEDQIGCSATLSGNPTPCIKTAIELLSFEGRAEAIGNYLHWATASENQNSHFEVERSLDGVNFEMIGKVMGADNSHTVQTYEFMDENVENAVSYYRLKTVDNEGKETYTHTILIERNHDVLNWSHVGPIPSSNQINVQFIAPTEGEFTLAIYDVAGRLINQQVLITNTGLNTFDLEVSNWNSGVYFLNISGANQSIFKRIVKE